MDIISYPCTNINQSISVKEPKLAINMIMLVMYIFWRARYWKRYAGTRKQSSSWVGWFSILAYCNQCARRKWVLPRTTIMHAKTTCWWGLVEWHVWPAYDFKLRGTPNTNVSLAICKSLEKLLSNMQRWSVTSSESLPINGSISNFFHLILDAD